MNTTLVKDAINKSFSRQASSYALHAQVQTRSAHMLANFIEESKTLLPHGTILELGCGTGLLTKHLSNMFPESRIIASDTSQSMLEQCKKSLAPLPATLTLTQIDADEFGADKFGAEQLALITSSFSLQWVSDFYATLERLLSHLEPCGQLVFSIPVRGSFAEWKEQCEASNVPFTANQLPQKSELIKWCQNHSLTLQWQQQEVVVHYGSALEFFQSLKGVGAAINTNGSTLSSGQLRKLIRTWDGHRNAARQEESGDNNTAVTYRVLLAKITRGYDT